MVLAHRAALRVRLNDALFKEWGIVSTQKWGHFRVRCSSDPTFQEAHVPTLFRFLFVVAVLAGLGFAAMFALATFVQPNPREITVPVHTGRTPSSS